MKIVSNKHKIALTKDYSSKESEVMDLVIGLRYFIAMDVVDYYSDQYGKTKVYKTLQSIEDKAKVMSMNKKWFLASFRYTEKPRVIAANQVKGITTKIYYTYRELRKINKKGNVVNTHIVKANALLAHMVLTKRISSEYIYNNSEIKEHITEITGIQIKDYSSDAMILDKKTNMLYLVITPFGDSDESLVKRINTLYRTYNHKDILTKFRIVPLHYSDKKREEFLYHLQVVKAMNKNKFDDNPMEVFSIENYGLKNTFALYEK